MLETPALSVPVLEPAGDGFLSWRLRFNPGAWFPPFACRLQGNYAFMEEVNRHQALLPLFGRAPQLAKNVFVAPNAAVTGQVSLGEGSSVW